MPQAVVADTKAAVCCRLVIVRPRSNQFFRFVLFHVADYIYCSCHLNLIRCNSFTHTDISFSASHFSASRGVWGENVADVLPRNGTLPPLTI